LRFLFVEQIADHKFIQLDAAAVYLEAVCCCIVIKHSPNLLFAVQLIFWSCTAAQ